jgi:hypothetical protein
MASPAKPITAALVDDYNVVLSPRGPWADVSVKVTSFSCSRGNVLSRE